MIALTGHTHAHNTNAGNNKTRGSQERIEAIRLPFLFDLKRRLLSLARVPFVIQYQPRRAYGLTKTKTRVWNNSTNIYRAKRLSCSFHSWFHLPLVTQTSFHRNETKCMWRYSRRLARRQIQSLNSLECETKRVNWSVKQQQRRRQRRTTTTTIHSVR
jgi:hypothetical protein